MEHQFSEVQSSAGFVTNGIRAVGPRTMNKGFEIDEDRRQVLCQLIRKWAEAMDRHYENMLAGIQQLSETFKQYRDGEEPELLGDAVKEEEPESEEIEQDSFPDNEVKLTQQEKHHLLPQEFMAYNGAKSVEYELKKLMPEEHFSLPTGPCEWPARRHDGSKMGGDPVLQLDTGQFKALLKEVCEETKIAELKVKLGAFEMHMKRNIDGPPIYAPVVPQTTTTHVPSEPASESSRAVPRPPSSQSSTEKVTPFTNVSAEKAAKLAALEAAGSSGYVIVSSPTVGSFRRARTLKGKKQAPACKEGGVIKEGQVIGFVDQFGTELPVKSDIAGEVLKLLYSDGEAVGYGDPLIAVLPSSK